jgi:hypothetical protein
MGIPFLGDLIKPVADLVSEVVVDKDKRDQINFQLAQLDDAAQARIDAAVASQVDVNKIEAASPNLFVAGWRPFVGWVGGFGLLYSVFVEPFMEFVSKTMFHYAGTFPVINTEVLLQVLLGLLGLGVMRSYDKTKGTETPTIQSARSIAKVTAISNPLPEAEPPKKKHFHIF